MSQRTTPMRRRSVQLPLPPNASSNNLINPLSSVSVDNSINNSSAGNASSSNDQSSSSSSASDAIKVICRFRPVRISHRESMRHERPADGDSYNLSEETNEVEFVSIFQDRKVFKFDKVFRDTSTQIQVFEEVKEVVGSVMAGFNGTVMAYGQTSAGKSYTMEGLSLWDPESQGLIPRCVDLLFREINNADANVQFQVVVSYFEIYW